MSEACFGPLFLFVIVLSILLFSSCFFKDNFRQKRKEKSMITHIPWTRFNTSSLLVSSFSVVTDVMPLYPKCAFLKNRKSGTFCSCASAPCLTLWLLTCIAQLSGPGLATSASHPGHWFDPLESLPSDFLNPNLWGLWHTLETESYRPLGGHRSRRYTENPAKLITL